ncbi:MAG: helix-turn-helix domain-containing protein, partial [Acidimicrobiales bacterium]
MARGSAGSSRSARPARPPAKGKAPERRPTSTEGGTADRILDAALASFGARGYEATSLDALAEGLGVRKQSILYWFPSKEVL